MLANAKVWAVKWVAGTKGFASKLASTESDLMLLPVQPSNTAFSAHCT